jgi:hypothetical protein
VLLGGMLNPGLAVVIHLLTLLTELTPVSAARCLC